MVGILVTGAGSCPSCASNTVTGSGEKGLLVEKGGGGTFERNRFDGNAVGCHIRGAGSNPTLKSNAVCCSAGAGVIVSDGGGGVMDSNEISANSGPGLLLETGAEMQTR